MMFYTDNAVLSCNYSSFSNRCLIILRAGSVGTEVKSVVTSYDVKHSQLESYLFGLVYKVTCTLYMMGRFVH